MEKNNERKKRQSKGRQTKGTPYFDYSLIAVVVFLICFGLVMLYSVSSYIALVENGDDMYYLKLQLRNAGIGLVAMYIASKIPYRFYAFGSYALFGVTLLAMGAVELFAEEINGAKRWLVIPGIGQFQPNELAKIAMILLIPYMVCQMGGRLTFKRGALKILVMGMFTAFCVLTLTDNMSTAIIVMGIVCGILFVVWPNMKYLLALVLVTLPVGYFALLRWSAGVNPGDYGFRIDRILAWLTPEAYASDKAYQTLQGLYAIGSGGFFGKGLGNGSQKLSAIPEVQNDMILAAICEELGVFGALVILLLFAMLLYRLLFIARNAPDMYSTLVVVGIFTHIALQVIFNVAVVTNLMPNTGVTLPFISYGGTSILFILGEIGIALSISRSIKIDEGA